MRQEVGPCGRRCSLLAETEARACELEAQILREVEHGEAHCDDPPPATKPEPAWKRVGLEVDG